MGRNSPVRGRKMHGSVVATIFNGRATVLDGVLNEALQEVPQ